MPTQLAEDSTAWPIPSEELPDGQAWQASLEQHSGGPANVGTVHPMQAVGAVRSRDEGGLGADAWGTTGSTAWVLDGAGQPRGTRCCAYTERDLVVDADRLLVQHATVFGSDLVGLVHVVADELTSLHASRHDGTSGSWPGPAATLALAHADSRTLTWLLLGDCGVVVDGRLRVDDRLASIAGNERAKYRAIDRHPGDAWTALYRAELAARNTLDGYWVLTADGTNPAEQAVTGYASVQDVLLCTDGVHRLLRQIGDPNADLAAWLRPECDVDDPAGRLVELRDTAVARGLTPDDMALVLMRTGKSYANHTQSER